jgi:6-hydroxynicotinate reductase
MPPAPDPASPALAASVGGVPEPIVCDACPVLCRISRGRSGACDRYANIDGALTRVDPLVLMRRAAAGAAPSGAGEVVRFAGAGSAGDDWDGTLVGADVFVTGVGAGTTYPDYKPAPFIVGAQVDGVDTVTVVTEGIFSYCSFRVKIDTDRFLGPERALVRHRGEAVGHVTTQEYGSQFLSLGGVHHLTGGSQREGRVACDLMMALGNRQPVDLQVDDGARLTVQANHAPVVNGVPQQRMRVGCGSAAIGIFARQWLGHADEVVVVDDHITGVLSEHQAGRCLAVPPSGIRLHGRRSTPGRYFRVARPGTGWGGTDITDPLSIVAGFDPRHARPGLRLLMVSTTGDDAAWFELDAALRPVPAPMPAAVRAVVERIGANCEPSLVSVLYVAGAGGSLRAGVTLDPIRLTRSIKDLLVKVTCGGAPAYVWPGGGITVMVDVAAMPQASFGWVPTPALVSPIEFTMRRDDYAALGGHLDRVVPVAQALHAARTRLAPWNPAQPWPGSPPESLPATAAESSPATPPAPPLQGQP